MHIWKPFCIMMSKCFHELRPLLSLAHQCTFLIQYTVTVQRLQDIKPMEFNENMIKMTTKDENLKLY